MLSERYTPPYPYNNLVEDTSFLAKIVIEEFTNDRKVFQLSYDLKVNYLSHVKAQSLLNKISSVLRVDSIYSISEMYAKKKALIDVKGDGAIIVLKKSLQ